MTSESTTDESVLPDDIAEMFRDAYTAYRATIKGHESEKNKYRAQKKLAVLAMAGREKNWPYTEMAASCDLTPERLRQIVKFFSQEEHQPRVPQKTKDLFPEWKKQKRQRAPRKRRVRRSTLTEKEREDLRTLTAEAGKVSGSTPINDPKRKASKELSRKIMRLHDRGVIWRHLAEATGLKEGSVRARAMRHGYGKTPPSQVPFRDTTIYEEARKRKRRELAQKAREAKHPQKKKIA